jgi:parallel beta-helix repeat protein
MNGLTLLGTWIVAVSVLMTISTAARADDSAERVLVSVGVQDGDIRGEDHRALQAAVDYAAGLGGGTVEIGPGRYTMRNALRLRDNVRVVGVPGETVLVAHDGVASPLAKDGDCNQRAVSLTDPSGFRIGDGVAVSSKEWRAGFCVTTATLTERLDDNTFAISMPLYLDYNASKEGSVNLAFPVVGGWQIKGAAVEGITVEGNGDRGTWLDGCRGGGIYLFECEDVAIRNCVVRNYNGDGIAFQVSNRVVVEDCLAEQNKGYGLHPGSGSQEPAVRRNRSIGNGSDGMFVCWRVQHGVFEDNELRGNGRDGISIGHKDSDNVFRNNTIAENTKAGVQFRQEDEPMGAHRNVFEGNRILDNGGSIGNHAAVALTGNHTGVVFRGNTIGNSASGGRTQTGIYIGKEAKDFVEENNTFTEVATDVNREVAGKGTE